MPTEEYYKLYINYLDKLRGEAYDKGFLPPHLAADNIAYVNVVFGKYNVLTFDGEWTREP